MADDSNKDILTGNRFFSGLAPEYIEFLAQHAKRRKLANDEILFRHGDKALHFYLVLSGKLSIEVAAIEGPALTLQTLQPGAVVGWSWLIPPYEWHFQARAEAPTEVLELAGTEILARCEQEPRLGYELLKRFSGLMSERLQFARRKMMDEWKPAGFA